MSKQNNLTDFLTDVANAIRAKKGSTDLINPQNFSAEIAALSGGLEVIEMTETTATIEPNKVYVWGMVESLNITLGASTDVSDFFAFRFRCSKPTMTSLIVNGATWADDTELDAQGKPVLDLGSYYQCEIKGGTSALYARLMHYIPFEDSNVEAVLLAIGVGDGLGVTYKDAAKVTDISTWFKGNTDITAFSEFINFSGIRTLSQNAFQNCSSLTEIALPASLTSIGGTAFEGCSLMARVLNLENTKVTSIGGGAFRGCTLLTEIALPASLTSIGLSAFGRCSSLTRVINLENTKVTSIGGSVFYGCTSLTEIALPGTLTSIEGQSFYGCSSLTRVINLENTKVTSIEGAAFQGCSSLAEIALPDTLTSIGGSAFNSCSSLAEISLPAGVTSIGDRAFGSCKKLTRAINLENTQVTSIREWAFNNCSSLAEISLPAGVTSIEGGAFNGCTSLAEISLPAGMTSIGDGAFKGCTLLTEIALPASLTSIGGTAFGRCSSLTRVINLENTKVTSIGGSVFYGCTSLTEIALPGTLTSIGSQSFQGCSSLQYIRIEATTPPTLSATNAIPSTIGAIYVPDASVAAYQAATNWSSFASKIKGISEMPA